MRGCGVRQLAATGVKAWMRRRRHNGPALDAGTRSSATGQDGRRMWWLLPHLGVGEPCAVLTVHRPPGHGVPRDGHQAGTAAAGGVLQHAEERLGGRAG